MRWRTPPRGRRCGAQPGGDTTSVAHRRVPLLSVRRALNTRLSRRRRGCREAVRRGSGFFFDADTRRPSSRTPMGGSFSLPCWISPWCWWRKVTRFFSDETFYLSCACASTAVVAGSCGLVTYVVLSCMTLAAASLISTGFRCHDPRSGKLLNTERERLSQSAWAAKAAVGVVAAGVFAQYVIG